MRSRVERAKGLSEHISDDKYRAIFDEYWSDRRQDLGHYFRFLYNIIRFIDDNDGIDSDHATKEQYIKILRAQLSDYELALLLVTSIGPHGTKFQKYIKKYRILDNLPDELFITNEHRIIAAEKELFESRNEKDEKSTYHQ